MTTAFLGGQPLQWDSLNHYSLKLRLATCRHDTFILVIHRQSNTLLWDKHKWGSSLRTEHYPRQSRKSHTKINVKNTTFNTLLFNTLSFDCCTDKYPFRFLGGRYRVWGIDFHRGNSNYVFLSSFFRRVGLSGEHRGIWSGFVNNRKGETLYILCCSPHARMFLHGQGFWLKWCCLHICGWQLCTIYVGHLVIKATFLQKVVSGVFLLLRLTKPSELALTEYYIHTRGSNSKWFNIELILIYFYCAHNLKLSKICANSFHKYGKERQVKMRSFS